LFSHHWRWATVLRFFLHGSRWHAFCQSPTLGSGMKNHPQNKHLFPKDTLLSHWIEKDHPISSINIAISLRIGL
jgi:hypothetical protein